MRDNKEKNFINERIIGRELTVRRAIKYLLLSLLCGIVFGGAAFGVFYLARTGMQKKAQQEQTKAAGTAGEASAESERMTEETEPAPERKTEPAAEQETEIPEKKTEETEPNTDESVSTETQDGKTAEPENGKTAEPENGKTAETEDSASQEKTEGETEFPDISTETAEFTEQQKERLREFLSQEKETYRPGPEDLNGLLGAQPEVCRQIGKYLVKVCCTISSVTWFESMVETQRISSGIIAGVTEDEVLVLTVKSAVTDGGNYDVIFHDGTRQAAVVKKIAGRDGWVMFAVSKEGLGTEFADSLEAVKIMPQAEITEGVPVITGGSPMGMPGSYGFGYLNYVGATESAVDSSFFCCYTEAASEPASGTFLMSGDGRLIGLGIVREEDTVKGSCFLAADSCSSMIESLKKGYQQAKLGITGTDISFDMKYKNIPVGMYVTAVEENSPASRAGLKRGDIIVMIGSREIRGLADYCSFMRNLRPEETITMTVRREAARSEYGELELILTAEAR